MNYFFPPESYRVNLLEDQAPTTGTHTAATFVLGKPRDAGGNDYVYDPNKDIVIITQDHRLRRIGNTYDLPRVYGVRSMTGSRDPEYAPFDFIRLAPENSSFTSGVFRFRTTGDPEIVYISYDGTYKEYSTEVTFDDPVLISDVIYDGDTRVANPPQHQSGPFEVRLHANGTINYSGMQHEVTSSRVGHPGNITAPWTYIQLYDVNDSELGLFYSSIGTPSMAHPGKPIFTPGISHGVSNFEPQGPKITVKGKDSEGNTTATDEHTVRL